MLELRSIRQTARNPSRVAGSDRAGKDPANASKAEWAVCFRARSHSYASAI